MQYPKDDIQEDILKAAGKVFLEKGFPKTSMREIAEEAQVGLERFKEELLMHRVAEEDLEKIVTEYITFEVTGWRELMKI